MRCRLWKSGRDGISLSLSRSLFLCLSLRLFLSISPLLSRVRTGDTNNRIFHGFQPRSHSPEVRIAIRPGDDGIVRICQRENRTRDPDAWIIKYTKHPAIETRPPRGKNR